MIKRQFRLDSLVYDEYLQTVPKYSITLPETGIFHTLYSVRRALSV